MKILNSSSESAINLNEVSVYQVLDICQFKLESAEDLNEV